MSAEHPDSAGGSPEAASSGDSRYVLLAEDDDDTRSTLAELLRDSGWRVREAKDGAAFLDVLAACYFDKREAPPDIIVTDVRMPGFNGVNVVEGLREMGIQTPVVVTSGFGDAALRRRVHAWGAAAFVDKPFDAAHLESTLDRLLVEVGESP